MAKEFFHVNINKYNTDKDFFLTRPASLNNPHDHSVMFCTKEHLGETDKLAMVDDCLVFWPEGEKIPEELRDKHEFVYAENPRQAYAMFFAENEITFYPHLCDYDLINGAYICVGAQVGKDTEIFPGAYIDKDVVIGEHCYIGAGVKILGSSLIGDNVIIRENTVIGADGLSTMRKEDGSAATIPQFGGVVIENDVQIGANAIIARGAIDNTIIRRGSKIDNCCFISHNVDIGEDTFIVGETIMFGSSKTGKQAYISGNSTIREGITVGANALVGMGSVVVKPVPEDTIVKGNPAK